MTAWTMAGRAAGMKNRCALGHWQAAQLEIFESRNGDGWDLMPMEERFGGGIGGRAIVPVNRIQPELEVEQGERQLIEFSIVIGSRGKIGSGPNRLDGPDTEFTPARDIIGNA